MEELLGGEVSSYELCADRVPEELRREIAEVSTTYRETGESVTAHLDGNSGPEVAAA